jgi:hypothetical protein
MLLNPELKLLSPLLGTVRGLLMTLDTAANASLDPYRPEIAALQDRLETVILPAYKLVNLAPMTGREPDYATFAAQLEDFAKEVFALGEQIQAAHAA